MIDSDETTTEAHPAPDGRAIRRSTGGDVPVGSWMTLLLLDAVVILTAVAVASIVTSRVVTVSAVITVAPPVWLGALALRWRYNKRHATRCGRAVADLEAGLLASAAIVFVSELASSPLPVGWHASVFGLVTIGLFSTRELEISAPWGASLAIGSPNGVELPTLDRPPRQGEATWLSDRVAASPEDPELENELELVAPPISKRTRVVSRALDVLVSAVLLVLAAPVLLVAAIVLWLSPGPLLERTPSVAPSGRRFDLLRFSVDGAGRRPSRAGQLLAHTSINEFPQLWNVLRGDMSLFGPRPWPAELLALRPPVPPGGLYVDVVKPLLDRVAAAVLLLVILPVIVAVAIAVRLSLGREILYRQERIGRGGHSFYVVKFRTMHQDRRSSWRGAFHGPDRRISHKRSDDPRHTTLGRFLRKTSLDELPQFWNVLRGEMSFVGPRPELRSVVEQCYEPWQHERHLVKPGITGLWQVSARDESPMHLHTALDIEYVETISFRTDLRILLQTIPALFKRSGS